MISWNKSEKKVLSLCLLLVGFLVVADQWLKVLAVDHLKGQLGYSYFDGIVRVEYAENRGAFLSLGATLSDEQRTWFFVVGVFAILAFCFYAFFRSLSRPWLAFSYALVIAGGVGNLIDRIAQGFVVDYVHMGFGWLRTGVFNLADVAISAGILLLLAMEIAPKRKES